MHACISRQVERTSTPLWKASSEPRGPAEPVTSNSSMLRVGTVCACTACVLDCCCSVNKVRQLDTRACLRSCRAASARGTSFPHWASTMRASSSPHPWRPVTAAAVGTTAPPPQARPPTPASPRAPQPDGGACPPDIRCGAESRQGTPIASSVGCGRDVGWTRCCCSSRAWACARSASMRATAAMDEMHGMVDVARVLRCARDCCSTTYSRHARHANPAAHESLVTGRRRTHAARAVDDPVALLCGHNAALAEPAVLQWATTTTRGTRRRLQYTQRKAGRAPLNMAKKPLSNETWQLPHRCRLISGRRMSFGASTSTNSVGSRRAAAATKTTHRLRRVARMSA